MSSTEGGTGSPRGDAFLRCGIDVGTSYLKVSFVDEGGRTVSATRRRSPVSSVLAGEPVFRPFAWFEEVLSAIAQAAPGAGRAGRLAFACVSPVLVVMPWDRPADAVALPYWTLPDVDRRGRSGGVGGTTAGLARTIRRLEHLASSLGGGRVADTDLGGYFVYLLTGRLTLNCATAAEMGIGSWSDLDEVRGAVRTAELPILGSPSSLAGTVRSDGAHEIVSLLAGWDVTFGGSDSFAAALSTGAGRPGDLMVYLGTFASLLRTRDDLAALPLSEPWPRSPYEWVVSVPGFGKHLEARAGEMFPQRGLSDALAALVDLAGQAPAGAGGEILRVPVWGDDGLARGSYDLPSVPSSRSRRALMARAVLESPAYPLLALGEPRVAELDPITGRSRGSSSRPPWRVAGGGSRSRGWLEILAIALGHHFVVKDDPTGNAGAIVFATPGPTVQASAGATILTVDETADRTAIRGNLDRVRSHYVTQQYDERDRTRDRNILDSGATDSGEIR